MSLLPVWTGVISAIVIMAAAHAVAEEAGEKTSGSGSAAQIEPMVAPVKRKAPKTPVLEEPPKPKGSSEGGEKGAKARKPPGPIVPSRPNCDPGFKVDEAGKACVRASDGAGKSKAQKTPAKKKR